MIVDAEGAAGRRQAAPRPLLSIRGIDKSFPGVKALSRVDFDVSAGEVHAIVGENGAGKSTLVKILSGLQQADSGVIEWCGQAVSIRSPRAAAQLGIGTVQQELFLVPDLSVAENFLLGRPPTRRWLGVPVVDHRQMNRQAQEILERLHVSVDPRTPLRSLGAAERQIVQIARALFHSARLIILDEPTASLTRRETERLFELISSLKAGGVAFIYISHHLEEVLEIADRVTVLRDGERVATRTMKDLTTADLIRLMVGRNLSDLYPKVPVEPGEVVLRARGLTRRGVFSDISFEVRRGEILGVYGLVGAKRTDLMRCIFGVDPLDAGELEINGHRVRKLTPARAIRLGLGFLPEERKQYGLALRHCIKDNITISSLPRFAHGGLLRARPEVAAAVESMRRLRIKAPSWREAVGNLSGGNQQKVVVSRWLLAGTRIFLFDEPTRGIDVVTKTEIYQLIEELVGGGAAVVMVSSELPEILGMADRILVMREGRAIALLTRDEATEERVMAYAFGHS